MNRLPASSRGTQATAVSSDGSGASDRLSAYKPIPSIVESLVKNTAEDASTQSKEPPKQFCIFNFDDEDEW